MARRIGSVMEDSERVIDGRSAPQSRARNHHGADEGAGVCRPRLHGRMLGDAGRSSRRCGHQCGAGAADDRDGCRRTGHRAEPADSSNSRLPRPFRCRTRQPGGSDRSHKRADGRGSAGNGSLQAAAAAGQPLALQATGVNAMASPIYSTQARSGALVSTVDGQQTQVSPVSNSLYRAQVTDPVTGTVPQQVAPQALPQQGAEAVLPPATAAATAELAAADPKTMPTPVSGSDETGGTPASTPDALALAALAAAKRKQRAGEATEVAALGFAPQQADPAQTAASSGKHARMLYDDYDDGAAEEPAATEVAMLPGLARLAPNGLWLQTQTVETGCFKPDLLNVLHKIEAHYGKKLVVTSGFRDPVDRSGRDIPCMRPARPPTSSFPASANGSLRRICAACLAAAASAPTAIRNRCISTRRSSATGTGDAAGARRNGAPSRSRAVRHVHTTKPSACLRGRFFVSDRQILSMS